MRQLALLIALFPALAGAGEGGATPRGKRTPRPKATHLTVAAASLDVGGAKVPLDPGVPLAVGAMAAKGKVRVTVLGAVVLSGTLEVQAIGKVVRADSELRALDGQGRLGTARAGAGLRTPPGRKAPAGMVAVASVGPVILEALLPADALAAEPRELVIHEDWNARTEKAAELFATAQLKAPALARLEPGARLVLLEHKGEVAHVRTQGALAVEGWTLAANVGDKQATDLDKPAERIKPSHEVFVDAPLYAAGEGKRSLGVVRGGTLVQAEKLLVGDPAARAKVKILGPVKATGYMKLADLRKLEESVWSEEGR